MMYGFILFRADGAVVDGGWFCAERRGWASSTRPFTTHELRGGWMDGWMDGGWVAVDTRFSHEPNIYIYIYKTLVVYKMGGFATHFIMYNQGL
jgi:hypothetical protein